MFETLVEALEDMVGANSQEREAMCQRKSLQRGVYVVTRMRKEKFWAGRANIFEVNAFFWSYT